MSENECECIGMSRTVEIIGRFGLHEHSGTGRSPRMETNTGHALGREHGWEWKSQGTRWDGTPGNGSRRHAGTVTRGDALGWNT